MSNEQSIRDEVADDSAPCECGHPRVEHDDGVGECYLSGCKCRTFEKAQTATDDEPVAYAIYGRATGNLKYVQVMDEHEVEEQSEFYDVVPLFRRTVQGEPTDAEAWAAARAVAAMRKQETGVPAWFNVEHARAALRAAATVREEGEKR